MSKRKFEPPWLAPDEGLPLKGERVLICREKDPGEYIVEQAWLTENGWWKVFGTNCKRIRAWRPMPKPPVEDWYETPEPVVRGRWVINNGRWCCNKCTCQAIVIRSPFCPNCGADMREA